MVESAAFDSASLIDSLEALTSKVLGSDLLPMCALSFFTNYVNLSACRTHF